KMLIPIPAGAILNATTGCYSICSHSWSVSVALNAGCCARDISDPTYYRPLCDGEYVFVDGGIWANNPVMIALVEALASFDVKREQIRILSIGCGGTKLTWGGLLQWRDIVNAAMRLQSQNALGQAGLLIAIWRRRSTRCSSARSGASTVAF